MKKCKTCVHFRPCEDNHKRGKCVNQERHDEAMVHYYGSLKETDYCAQHKSKKKVVRL